MNLQNISEQTGIREEVLLFALKMEEKLKLNDKKGGWITTDKWFLFRKLNAEVDELRAELDCTPLAMSRDRRAKVINEAADVANFSMMIAEKAVRDCL